MTLLFAAGLLTIVAAACGAQQAQSDDQSSGNSSNNSGDQPETVIIRDDSDDPDPDDTQMGDADADDNMQPASELPQGFIVPVPNDYQVQRVGESRGEVSVDLQAPDGQQAYDYYTNNLEDEGFTVEESSVDNDSANFDADIDFRNDQYDGSIDFSGDTVQIDYEPLNVSDVSDDSNGAQTSTQVPQGFPVAIPNDYDVQNVREGGDGTDDAGDITVQLDVPDGQQAFDYYTGNLQSDGFTVQSSTVDSDSSVFEGEIDFTGTDYNGSIDVDGNSVEIDLDNANSATDDNDVDDDSDDDNDL